MDTSLIKKARKGPTRRRFSSQFKQQIVMQSMKPGASLSALALANSLNSNQVFKWRRDYLQQQGKGPVAKPDIMLPVVITTREEAPLSAPASRSVAASGGYIEITFAHGQIRIEGAVDANTLRTLVQSMRA